jgi:hypothetical protein
MGLTRRLKGFETVAARDLLWDTSNPCENVKRAID